MLKQCAIYFGFEEGEAAQTAFTPAEQKAMDDARPRSATQSNSRSLTRVSVL